MRAFNLASAWVAANALFGGIGLAASPRPQDVSLGDQRAYAPSRHVSGYGRGSLSVNLMARLGLGFVAKPIAIPTEAPPVVLSDGTVVVVGRNRLAWLGPAGKKTHLVEVEPRSHRAYAWTSAGRFLVASGAATETRIVAYDRRGTVRWETPVSGEVEVIEPGPAGTFIYTGNSEITWCWADGSIRARADLPSLGVEGRVFADGDDVILVGPRGPVWRWRPPEVPRKVASLPSSFSVVERVSAFGLVAKTAPNRLVALDVTTGQQRDFYVEKVKTFVSDPLFIRARRRLAVLRSDGVLLLLDPSGKAEEVPVFGSALAKTRVRRAWIHAGKGGRIAVAAQDGRLRLVDVDGGAGSLAVPCPQVASLRPGGLGRLIVGCADATVVEIIDAAEKKTKN